MGFDTAGCSGADLSGLGTNHKEDPAAQGRSKSRALREFTKKTQLLGRNYRLFQTVDEAEKLIDVDRLGNQSKVAYL